ncbi:MULTISPECIES: hypothetical protein [Vagococcus]|uniref:Uncharacterized protein n=1 Tax=Vagococcus fluvialis bH819 TaxID=1255619 RepID=A0A1X6WR02_9ENTE|nr:MULTISPECIES: hypothetical protein [Vagococcus]SLM86707.1 hypothetical protein FM121_11470 [Vagococcus fluvialis bH819]HCM90915.1 hypothetical protein [Vagococcus sp.]
MPEKLKSVVYFLDNHEWINTVISLIMAASGIYLFFHHTASIYELFIMVGLFAILKGFLNFNTFFIIETINKHNKQKNMFLIGALVNIFIGTLIILNIITNPLSLLIITSVWMIIDSIPYLVYVLKKRLGQQYKINPYKITFSLILVCSIITIVSHYTLIFGPAIPMGCFLLLASTNILLFQREH